jgi:hypothetical protein
MNLNNENNKAKKAISQPIELTLLQNCLRPKPFVQLKENLTAYQNDGIEKCAECATTMKA